MTSAAAGSDVSDAALLLTDWAAANLSDSAAAAAAVASVAAVAESTGIATVAAARGAAAAAVSSPTAAAPVASCCCFSCCCFSCCCCSCCCCCCCCCCWFVLLSPLGLSSCGPVAAAACSDESVSLLLALYGQTKRRSKRRQVTETREMQHRGLEFKQLDIAAAAAAAAAAARRSRGLWGPAAARCCWQPERR